MQADDCQAACDESLNESDLMLAAIDVLAVQNAMPEPVVSSTSNVLVPGLSEARTSSSRREDNNVCDNMSSDVLDLVDNLMSCSQTENRCSLNLNRNSVNVGMNIMADESQKNSRVENVQKTTYHSVQRGPRVLSSRCSASAAAPTAAPTIVEIINPVLRGGNTEGAARIRRGGGRLAERVKMTLKENAKVDTPVRPISISVSVGDEQVNVVEDSVCRFVEREQSTFYGLPLTVKQLLETHRGITSLYRMFFLYVFESISKLI